MNTLNEALGIVFAMGAVILFCRAFPFLFSGRKERANAVFAFIEKTVPPAAMTVLAFNALGSGFGENAADGVLVLAASAVTALIHLWKRNSLLSIVGGTILYMLLKR